MNEMKRMTWKEFLSECDISDWKWTFPEEEEVISETEDYWVVRVYVGDILDQPDIFYIKDEDGNFIVEWGGIPVNIVDTDNVPDIYIKIWKTEVHGVYYCDGQFYFDLKEIE